MNVDRRTYAKWEEGTTEVKSSLLPKLADVFEVEIVDLYGIKKLSKCKDSFRDNKNSINNAVIIITDKELIDKLVNVINQIKAK